MSQYNTFPSASAHYAFPMERQFAHATIRQEFENGSEHARPRWHRSKRAYSLKFSTLTATEMNALVDFFNQQKGSALPFLFDDPRLSTVTGEAVGTGNGSTTQFALANLFIQSSTVKVYLNGQQTMNFSLSDDAGIVTFNSAPGNGVAITADYRYSVLCRFKADMFKEEQFAAGYFNSNVEMEEVFS